MTFRLFLYSYELPYRLFLDDGVYFVQATRARWRITLETLPRTCIETTVPPVDFGDRAQLYLDNHGFTGVTRVRAGFPLEPPLTEEQLNAFLISPDRVTLAESIQAVNLLVARYRAQTNEFWYRSIGKKDVPAFTTFAARIDSNEVEWFGFSTNAEIASGYPYLKRESWYADFLERLEAGERVPFALDLLHEGHDAFARDNLRLAASNFALFAEALFRGLLLEFFPTEDVTRPAKQMLGTYFRRYREVADPSTLPTTKKKALEHFDIVWRLRDDLMHGHDLSLMEGDVRAAGEAATQLFELWQFRPHAKPLLIEGPFAKGSLENRVGRLDFPSQDAGELLHRAIMRYEGGHLRDASEAASYALLLDSDSLDALMLLGSISFQEDRVDDAVSYFERAVRAHPGSAEQSTI